jgi:hypothetical protein
MKHVLRFTKSFIFRYVPLVFLAMLGINNADAQTNLIIATDGGDFSWTSDPRNTYTYPSGDVIKYLFSTSIEGGGFTFKDTAITTSTSAICAPAVRRVQVNAFELVLNSTSVSKIVINGNSSGGGARYIRAVYVNDVIEIENGDDPRIKAFHPGGSASENCGDMVIEGLNIAKGQTVKIIIGGSTTGTPQNFRVNRITLTEGVLPVRLLSFDAFKRTNGVEVTWKASNEAEGKSYSVERSNNGQDFEVLKKVETLGAGLYSFLDNTPKPGRIAYYRLQMESVDGEKTYSKIKAVNLDGSGALKLFPNPAVNGNLFATFSPVTEPTLVRILNPSGQVVQTMQIAAFTEQAQINTAGLKAGVYMLQIVNGSEIKTGRFLKQ